MDKSTVFILLDRPSYDNDKKWLVDHVCKTWEGMVVPVYSRYILSKVYRSGKLGMIRVMLEVLRQCLGLVYRSKKGDVVICWSPLSSWIFYLLTFGGLMKRYMVCMNWLSPNSNMKVKWKNKMLAVNKRCRVVVNSPESIQQWKNILRLNDTDNFCHITDVYDERVPFKHIVHRTKDYIFTGGMNNRDWNVVMQLAANNPDLRFVCCALKSDFMDKVKIAPPQNVKIYFNTESGHYYELLAGSYLVLLPLCTQRVSGLINIIRSAQEGIICLTSDIPSTSQYYSEKDKDLLIPFEMNIWQERLNEVLKLDDVAYIHKAQSFQEYIKTKFSPETASKRIVEEIHKLIRDNER